MAKKTISKGLTKQKERVQYIRAIKNPKTGSYAFRKEMLDKDQLEKARKSR